MTHSEYLNDLIFDSNGLDYGAVMNYEKDNDKRLDNFISSIFAPE